MPNFDWLLQCVEDKMDVSQDFTDSPRTCIYKILKISSQSLVVDFTKYALLATIQYVQW